MSRSKNLGGWCRRHKLRSGLIVALLVVGSSVAAYAAWTSLSNGNAGGSTGKSTAPTFVFSNTVTSPCVPGGDCDGAVTITNPASNGPVHITSYTQSNPVPAMFTTSTAACDPSLFTQNTVNGSGVVQTVNVNIPVPVGTTTVIIPNLFHLDASAPDGCQNIQFETSNNPLQLSYSTP